MYGCGEWRNKMYDTRVLAEIEDKEMWEQAGANDGGREQR